MAPSVYRAGATFMLLVALFSASALGQTAPKPSGAPPSNPPAAKRTESPPANEFHLNVAMGERGTSNPTFAPESQDIQGDYITDLRPDLSMRRKSPRTDWSLDYRLFIVRYREHSEMDSLNHGFGYGGTYDLSRTAKLVLSESFSYSRDPVLVATPEAGNPAIFKTPEKEWRNFSDVRADFALSRTLTFQVGAGAHADRYQAAGLVDSNGYSQRLGLSKEISEYNSLTGSYGHSRFLFSAEGVADVDSNDLMVDWMHKVADRLHFDCSGGSSFVTREGETQRLFTGGFGLGRTAARSSLTMNYRRSISADVGIDSVSVADSAFFGFSHAVGERGTMGLSADLGRRQSILTGENLDLRFYGAALRGSISLTDRWGLTGAIGGRQQRGYSGVNDDWKVASFYVGVTVRIL